jgi:hypothetical protein
LLHQLWCARTNSLLHVAKGFYSYTKTFKSRGQSIPSNILLIDQQPCVLRRSSFVRIIHGHWTSTLLICIGQSTLPPISPWLMQGYFAGRPSHLGWLRPASQITIYCPQHKKKHLALPGVDSVTLLLWSNGVRTPKCLRLSLLMQRG